MAANLLRQAYDTARDLLSRHRAEPRPAFIVPLIGISASFFLSLSIAHMTWGFRLPFYAAWFPPYLGFLVVALLIAAGGKELSRYNLDRVSLICIILFAGFLGPWPAGGPAWAAVIWVVPQLALAVWLWRRLRAIRGFGGGRLVDIPRYLFGGAAVAVLLFLVATRFDYRYALWVSTLLYARPLLVIEPFTISMSIAAVIEEPMYRGFLLGHLIRDRGWKPVPALLVQTAVFMAIHFYHLDNPYAFWVVGPFTGLVLGIVTLRSRSIATAMFAHAMYDALADIVASARAA